MDTRQELQVDIQVLIIMQHMGVAILVRIYMYMYMYMMDGWQNGSQYHTKSHNALLKGVLVN